MRRVGRLPTCVLCVLAVALPVRASTMQQAFFGSDPDQPVSREAADGFDAGVARTGSPPVDYDGTIEGQVTANDSGLAITAGVVRIFDQAGILQGSALILADGSYRYGGLAAGIYYARTHGTGYFDELWHGIPCPQGLCTVTAGTPIRVSGSTATANFRLLAGAALAGSVVIDASGLPVTSGSVRIYDAYGNWLGSAPISEHGGFWYGGLDSGTYYLRTCATGLADDWWQVLRSVDAQRGAGAATPVGVSMAGLRLLQFRLIDSDDLPLISR